MPDALTIPSSTEHLARVRAFVSERARHAGLGGDDIAELRLAVDEACTNAIEHAYAGREDGTVTVEAERAGDSFVVAIRHTGVPFDPTAYDPLPLPEAIRHRRRGGFGVMLMNRCCDAVEYSRSGRVSEVRLSKRLVNSARQSG